MKIQESGKRGWRGFLEWWQRYVPADSLSSNLEMEQMNADLSSDVSWKRFEMIVYPMDLNTWK